MATLYRKKVEERIETYVGLDTEVTKRGCLPPQGFIIHLHEPIPFIATSTVKDIESVELFPYFNAIDFEPIILCEDGWVEIDKEEYDKELIGALEHMTTFKYDFEIIERDNG